MFLTVRLAVLAAAVTALALLVPGAPAVAVLLADGLLLLAAAFDVAVGPDPRRLVQRREHPDVVAIGRQAEVALLLQHAGRRGVPVAVRDLVPASLGAEPDVVHGVVDAAPMKLRYRIRPRRRGRFELRAATVRTFGPLGLAGRQRTVPVHSRLKVYPALGGRERVEGRLRRSRLLEVGTRSARIRGGGLEFDSLREYHPDDEFRRINWTATARAGTAVSNVHREERNQQVLLLLDAGRTMAGTVAGAPRFEHALDAAVALAGLAVTVGDRVGAFSFVDGIRAGVPPRADGAQPARILDALFDAEPEVAAADYLGSIGVVLQRFRRRALVVLFTDLADEAAADPLLRTVPILARRHLVVVVEVTDPEVERAARTVPGAAADAYRKAAAAQTQGLRDRAGRRLGQLGAWVVDSSPDELAVAVGDTYLRAKAFGRL